MEEPGALPMLDGVGLGEEEQYDPLEEPEAEPEPDTAHVERQTAQDRRQALLQLAKKVGGGVHSSSAVEPRLLHGSDRTAVCGNLCKQLLG